MNEIILHIMSICSFICVCVFFFLVFLREKRISRDARSLIRIYADLNPRLIESIKELRHEIDLIRFEINSKNKEKKG